jgi:hypothetical protein
MEFFFKQLWFIRQTSRSSFVPMLTIIFHLLVLEGVHCLLGVVGDLVHTFQLMRIFQILNQAEVLKNMGFWY